ncbi:MAG: DUF2243 domain-containing protein [Pigmentiphaga sp.]
MATGSTSSLRCAGVMLGFALGGFFDGILLHQILQWHHLLSNVDAVRDMRTQVLFDGLFHLLMYVIAVIALIKLWRARRDVVQPTAGQCLWACALLGFGAWHIIDGLLSHWMLGIHRIKGDAASPFAWDVAWLVFFGIVPALIGWMQLRKSRHSGGGDGGGTAAVTLSLSVLLAGPISMVPSSDSTQVVVVFAPGVSAGDAFSTLAKIDARILWTDPAGGVWAVKLEDPGSTRQLFRHGAVWVSTTSVSLGCLSWTNA